VFGTDVDTYVNLFAKRGHYIIAVGVAGSPERDFGMSFLTRVHQSLSLHVFSMNAFSDEEIRKRMTQAISVRSATCPPCSRSGSFFPERCC